MSTDKRPTRRPRVWTAVTYEELEDWREQRGLTKLRMAELVGVTKSTYHNWARNVAVATPRTQQRIRRFLDQGGTAPIGDPVLPASEMSPTHRAGIAAVGQIVQSYLQTQPHLSSEELVELVYGVRRALSA